MKEEIFLLDSQSLKARIDNALDLLTDFLPTKLIEKTREILYSKSETDSKQSIEKDLNFLSILKQLVTNELTELSLKGSKLEPGIPDYGIELLCEALNNNTSLIQLDLSNNGLDSLSCQDRMFSISPIVQMLKQNCTLRYLDLSKNNIHEAGPLCEALKKNAALCSLNLSKNKLRATEPEINPFSLEEVFPLTLFSEVLEINISLQDLNLSENGYYYPTFEEYRNKKLSHLKNSPMFSFASYHLANSFMEKRKTLLNEENKLLHLDELALRKISELLDRNKEINNFGNDKEFVSHMISKNNQKESNFLDLEVQLLFLALKRLDKKESSEEIDKAIQILLSRIINLNPSKYTPPSCFSKYFHCSKSKLELNQKYESIKNDLDSDNELLTKHLENELFERKLKFYSKLPTKQFIRYVQNKREGNFLNLEIDWLLDALEWLSKKENSKEITCQMQELLKRIILLRSPINSSVALRRLYAQGNEFLSNIDSELEQLILKKPETYLFDNKNIQEANQENAKMVMNILKKVWIEKDYLHQTNHSQNDQRVFLIDSSKPISIKKVYPFFKKQILAEKFSKINKMNIEEVESFVQKLSNS